MEFSYQKNTHKDFEPGNYRFCIVSAVDQVSKSGKEMKVIEVKIDPVERPIKYFFVEGEYLNDKLSRFFDSCPEIREGNLNCIEWVGAMGAAKFDYDSNGYKVLKWFIPIDKQDNLPPYEGAKVEKQEVTNLEELGADEELPF